MKIKLGVIGPRVSVQPILDIAREFSDMQVYPLAYENIKETPELVEQHEHKIDVWLFSGIAPYQLVKENVTEKESYYLQLNGSSLTKVLVNMLNDNQSILEFLSIDSISERDVQETYSELGLSSKNMHVQSSQLSIEELIDFHNKLYQTGQVVACITGYYSVYLALQERSVPVYRIIPTRLTIRQTLDLIFHKVETLQFKQSQIAVQIIKISGFEDMIKNHIFSYDISRVSLKLQELILDYTEQIFGTFVALGHDKYMIFSTRGVVESVTSHSVVLVDKIYNLTNLTASIGIGYGLTSLAAEKNSNLALYHALSLPAPSVILVDEKGIITGPLQDSHQVSYQYRTEDFDLSNLLTKAGVSITTFEKILSIQSSFDHKSVTATTVAEWLGMTERNARRILTSLEKQGLAKVVGKETLHSKGRPRLIYRVGI